MDYINWTRTTQKLKWVLHNMITVKTQSNTKILFILRIQLAKTILGKTSWSRPISTSVSVSSWTQKFNVSVSSHLEKSGRVSVSDWKSNVSVLSRPWISRSRLHSCHFDIFIVQTDGETVTNKQQQLSHWIIFISSSEKKNASDMNEWLTAINQCMVKAYTHLTITQTFSAWQPDRTLIYKQYRLLETENSVDDRW